MENISKVTHIESVRLSDDGTCVVIIDQTQLPNRTEYLEFIFGGRYLGRYLYT